MEQILFLIAGLAYYIIREVLKGKKKPATRNPKTDTNADTGDGGSSWSLEDILEEITGEKSEDVKQYSPRQAGVQEVEKKAEKKRAYDSRRKDTYQEEDRTKAPVYKSKPLISERSQEEPEEYVSKYESLSSTNAGKAKKLDEMVSLDDRTRSNLEVVHLDDDEEVGSHADLIHALNDKDEFKKAFILSEIIRRKY